MRWSIQTVKKTPGGKWETVRYGFCESHKDAKGFPQRSIDFLGVTEDGWEFRCKETKQHMSHRFYCHPARNAPKTAAEAALWMQTEIAKMVINPDKMIK